MKVLVTGTTGFVGSCLTRRLVEMKNKEKGHTPIDVHIFTRSQSNKWRIVDLIGHVTNHEVDLRDAGAVEKAVVHIGPQVIYHLATYGGFTSQKETSAIIESNFMGTVNLLKACEKTGFNCFINTGSSSEYGIKAKPMRESDRLEPVGDYGVSKAAATLYCRSMALEKGLPIITMRLFSPYGLWDDPQRLIPYVIKSLLKGEPPKLSTTKSVRDFIYIDDVLEAFLKVITVPISGGEIYNVGSGVQYSIGEVVSIITKIIGNGLEPMWGKVNSRRSEPGSWIADISKTKTELGWFPATPLAAGLNKTVQWFGENLALYP